MPPLFYLFFAHRPEPHRLLPTLRSLLPTAEKMPLSYLMTTMAMLSAKSTPFVLLACRKYPRTADEHLTTSTCGFTFK